MTFSFKDILSHIEQTLITSIKELKKSKKAIRPETALYLFGLSLSSFFEDNVPDINFSDKGVQARLIESFRLGWKDGITGDMQSQQQIPSDTGAPIQQPPAGQQGVQVPGGAPVGPDQLGNLPMPNTAGGVPPAPGGAPPNPDNPEEEPPNPLNKTGLTSEKLDFRSIKRDFLNEGKFNGVNFRI